MIFDRISELDRLALELIGMACVMEDDGNRYQAKRLKEVAEKMLCISEEEKNASNHVCQCGGKCRETAE